MNPGDRLFELQSRLIDRDRLLLSWLHRHGVLTTEQIDAALFGGRRHAQHRMTTLYRLDLVDRFRPYRATGSYSWHYVLGRLGAALVATSSGESKRAAAGMLEAARSLATSRTLAHRLAVNDVFIGLAARARKAVAASAGSDPAGATAPMALERWWSERECAAPGAFGVGLASPVRPDGHGVWREGERRVAFLLEVDRGGESHSVLREKLTRYAEHLRRGGPPWPVLFCLPSHARERHLHDTVSAWALRAGSPTGPPYGAAIPDPSATQTRSGLVIATTTVEEVGTGDVAEAVWWVCGQALQRRRLIDLS